MTAMPARTAARRALRNVLGAAIVGWCLFVAGVIADIAIESGIPANQLYGPNATDIIRPSKYLIFGAVALIALTAVVAKNRMRAQRSTSAPPSPLTGAVEAFASTVVIITLVLSAVMAVGVFMSSFESSAGIDVIVRILDTYLPIVLFTALTVTVLLAGFVFAKHAPTAPAGDAATSPASADQSDVPVAVAVSAPDPQTRRATALAFTLPIVAIAAALIFGLIVYDFTKDALQVWIWVIVQLGVGAGIIAGTFYAAQAAETARQQGMPVAGVSIGAKNLNLVLSIIFAAVVAQMSLGFGASAAEQLRQNTFLSLSAYSYAPLTQDGVIENSPESKLSVMVGGSDLQRNSAASVTLEPGTEVLLDTEADWDGNVNGEAAIPSDIADGEYELVLRAQGEDGTAFELALALSVSDGLVSLPNGMETSSGDQPQTFLTPTLGWALSDLLPAFLMVVIAAELLFATLHVRNRDQIPAPASTQQ